MKHLAFLVAILLLGIPIYAQVPSVVNEYFQVIYVEDCSGYVGVTSTNMTLEAGDRVLIIQMKGGSIYNEDDSYATKDKQSGRIRNYNAAGNFEFATVSSVQNTSGNNYLVAFENDLKNLYEVGEWGRGPNTFDYNDGVQLVKIPTDQSGNIYADLEVTDISSAYGITASAWNGTTGGVVALEVSGTLILDVDIDVTGKGYRGGEASNTNTTDRTLKEKVYKNTTVKSGQKGEGIDQLRSYYDHGRGAAGNGGGGGNAEGAGGGGGSNYGAGGRGGMQRTATNEPDVKNGGEGGYPIAYSDLGVRAFMGAGGGGGHAGGQLTTAATRTPTDGARGGGIIIIRAARIEQQFDGELKANGEDADDATNAGGGGGGAGGTIILDISTYANASSLTIEASGGNGGEAQQDGVLVGTPAVRYSIGCFGPGGGGGGGLIWINGSTTPSFTVNVDGGAAGQASLINSTVAPPLGCDGSANRGAEQGGDGVVLAGLMVPGDPLP